jgi:hypothetical protein
MTNGDQARLLIMEAIVVLAPIARSIGVLDIDRTIAEIRLAMHKLESALMALSKGRQP